MGRRQIKILIGFILMTSVGLFIILNLYNKPHLNVKKAHADIKLTAQNLLDDYQNDENLANKNYVDKLVQVIGVVSEVSFDNGNSIITIKDSNGQSSIMCHMQPEENLNVLKIKKDRVVTIKGICTGYLLDVIMVRCVLINN